MTTHETVERYIQAGIAFIALVLLLLLVVFLRQYAQVRRANFIASHHSLLASLHARGPMSAADASSIQAWMTFDYINHVFALPEGYLMQKLDIQDSRYPRLTIEEYAEDAHTNREQLLEQVQSAVRSYFEGQQ